MRRILLFGLVALVAGCAGARDSMPPSTDQAEPAVPDSGRGEGTRPADAATPAEPYIPPGQIEVMPVFFVPSGESAPSADQKARLLKHLEWARQRYQEMLGGRDTFRLASSSSLVFRAGRPVTAYKDPETGPSELMFDLLDHFGANRFTLPYILVIVLMNSVDDEPAGGGRPSNGGLNIGGGFLAQKGQFRHRHFVWAAAVLACQRDVDYQCARRTWIAA